MLGAGVHPICLGAKVGSPSWKRPQFIAGSIQNAPTHIHAMDSSDLLCFLFKKPWTNRRSDNWQHLMCSKNLHHNFYGNSINGNKFHNLAIKFGYTCEGRFLFPFFFLITAHGQNTLWKQVCRMKCVCCPTVSILIGAQWLVPSAGFVPLSFLQPFGTGTK